MKYIIDSAGHAVELSDDAKEVRFIPLNIRINELNLFSNEIIAIMEKNGIKTNNMRFFYMIQPYGQRERAVFFSKTEFSSSSTAVKLAGELKIHPEILADRTKAEFLQSIIAVEGKELRQYFLLSIGYFEFERNIYDCKKIGINYFPPVPYNSFLNTMKAETASPADELNSHNTNSYIIINDKVNLSNPNTLLEYAVYRDIRQEGSLFDSLVDKSVEIYRHINNYDLKDRDSNRSTVCLLSINNQNNNIFAEYEQIKNCIKKTVKGAYNIRYKRNKVTAHLPDDSILDIYIQATGDTPKFIIKGNILNGIEELHQYLISDKTYTEQKWFTEKVQPYIRVNQDMPKKRRSSKRDELNWHKKIKKEKRNGRKSKQQQQSDPE